MTLLAILELILAFTAAAFLLFLIIATVVCVKLLFFTRNQTYQESMDILAQKGTLYTDALSADKLECVHIVGANDTPLTGYYANLFPESKKVVVLIHGIRANHIIGLQYAPLFIPYGYNLLAIDQRAHGLSGGRLSTYGYYEKTDLAAWLDYLHKRLGKDYEIGLMGHSMGAATVLNCPELDHNIRFIVADCPFDLLKDFLLYQLRMLGFLAHPVYGLLRLVTRLLWGFDPNVVTPGLIACTAGRDIPTLFIHSKGDRIIPYTCAQRMFEARGNPHDRLYIHDTAAHPDVYASDREMYRKSVDEFLSNIS